MKLKLIKDIVIPAGTVFDTAAIKVERAPGMHVEHTFAVGGSKDTYGTVTYMVGEKGSEERSQLTEYFQPVE